MTRCPRCHSVTLADHGGRWCPAHGELCEALHPEVAAQFRREAESGRCDARLSRHVPPPEAWQVGLGDVLDGETDW